MFATFSLPAACDFAAAPRAATVAVRSADDLRRALRQARSSALTLDATGMDRVLRVDPARGFAEVQAAAGWPALAAHPDLARLGLAAFSAMEATPRTVGAWVSHNPAGPDGAPFSRHVAALALASPDGELRRVDRDAAPELFALVVGGQGAFGVLYSVTLRLDSLAASAAAADAPAELCLDGGGVSAGGDCAIGLLLPPAELERFLADARAVCGERRVALRGITVRQTLPETETRLRWATREWAAVRIRFGAKSSLGAAVYAAETRRELLARALERGGSFPVCDLRDATRTQAEACHPALSAFLAEQRRCDPAGRLQNAWLARARAILRCPPCESRWSK